MKYLINKENYEQYALDYIEGNLEGDLLAAFERFLTEHPEIEEELEGMTEAMLEAENVMVPEFDIESLKMPVHAEGKIDKENYEDFVIEEVEGTLAADKQEELNAFMAANPALEADRELFHKTKLKADTSIRYESSDLRKPIPLFEYTQTVAFRVAAGVALLIGIASIVSQFESQMYQRRGGSEGFATMEALPIPTEAKSIESVPVSQPQFAQVNTAEMKQIAEREERTALMPMQRREASVSMTSEGTLATASFEAFETSVREWVDPVVEEASSPEELTIAQYLGREFLGKDPSLSAKEFMVDEVKKAADNSGLVKSSEDPSKRTFQLLAGAFEFKRVNYKN